MPFDLQQLRAFVVIVASGSLGRASAELNITQPALSRTIKRLEEAVGSPVFERHSKGMQLTDIGASLLPHATLLLRESDIAREEIAAMQGLAKGTVRVGAVGSIACMLLPQAIEGVLRKWPNLQVRAVEGVWDRLAEALLKHDVDLALAAEVPDTDDIVAIKDCRWQDTTYVVAASQHPLRRKRRLGLEDLMEASWAIPPRGTGPYEHMEQVFASHGMGMPAVAVETRSIILLKSLVTRSGFLSWLAESIYDADRQAGLMEALPLPGVVGKRTLTAYRRRHGILPGPTVKLLDELRRLTAA